MARVRPLGTLWTGIRRVAPLVIVLAILGLGWLAVHSLSFQSPDEGGDTTAGTPTTPGQVTLPPGKLAAADLAITTVTAGFVQPIHTVPGRIRYDETRHIDLKSPVDGILIDVVVQPGDAVSADAVLAVLESPEIGRARSAVLMRQATRDLEARQAERTAEIHRNLGDFLAALDQEVGIDGLETQFANKSLGVHRQGIFTALSTLRMAEKLDSSAIAAGTSGAISGRMVQERLTDRQIAEATFQTIREQAEFDASQTDLAARAAVAEAERQLTTARQQLAIVLGRPIDKTLSHDEPISSLDVIAPFAGSIESRQFGVSERVAAGDSLFVLADTTTLYVAADLREDDWAATSLSPGQTITLTVSALEEKTLSATIRYLGREVDPTTNAVPLVAAIDNHAGRLRPGMFVRVMVPIGPVVAGLVVDPAAVVRHEDQDFVFLEVSNGTFERRNVTTGDSAENGVVMTSGLIAGDRIVSRGADLLKAELLLEGE